MPALPLELWRGGSLVGMSSGANQHSPSGSSEQPLDMPAPSGELCAPRPGPAQWSRESGEPLEIFEEELRAPHQFRLRLEG